MSGMVQFELLNGRKGENDVLVKVYSYGEVLSFSELLFLLKNYFESENSYYPKPEFEGSTMLMKAVLEIFSGIPYEKVIEKYGLNRKHPVSIVDKRVRNEVRDKDAEMLRKELKGFMEVK